MDEETIWTGIYFFVIGGIFSIFALEIAWDILQTNLREIMCNVLLYILDTFEFVGTQVMSPEGQERMSPMYAMYRGIINFILLAGESLPGGLGGLRLKRFLFSHH